MTKTWILYGTSGCHLCEEAALLLQQAGLDYREVDIADDAQLLERFGWLIPVLADPDDASNGQLRWPFNQQQLSEWLRRCS